MTVRDTTLRDHTCDIMSLPTGRWDILSRPIGRLELGDTPLPPAKLQGKHLKNTICQVSECRITPYIIKNKIFAEPPTYPTLSHNAVHDVLLPTIDAGAFPGALEPPRPLQSPSEESDALTVLARVRPV